LLEGSSSNFTVSTFEFAPHRTQTN